MGVVSADKHPLPYEIAAKLAALREPSEAREDVLKAGRLLAADPFYPSDVVVQSVSLLLAEKILEVRRHN